MTTDRYCLVRLALAVVAVVGGCSTNSRSATLPGTAGNTMPSGGAGSGAGAARGGAGGSSPDANGAAAGETADAGGREVADASWDLGGAFSDAGATGDAHAPYPPRRSPNEVLVVYNANSPISTAVANDYARKRMVTNVMSVTCADSAISATNETISISDYTSKIATPISQYLASHSNIEFIVLTKGIPIRINGAMTGCCVNDTGGQHEPSLDSYLAAIDYPNLPDAKMIGITGSGTVGSGWLNRYWNAAVPFSHAQFGGYLVTRLDGYTQSDAMALVTRALAAEQSFPAGKVLFDVPLGFGLGDKSVEPAAVTGTITQESGYGTWNADMLRAHDLMEASGIPNELDLANTFIGGRSNLAGYFSWGSNDGHYDPSAYQSLSFAPGSISDTAVSTSARTFLPTSGGQSLLVDLIAHGLTGGKGYVGEPLLQGIASPSISLARYESGYSMAESLYAASRFVGWEDVVIGDPLCTPQSGRGDVIVPIQGGSFDSSSGGFKTEDCAEGGSDVANIGAGSYAAYKSVSLTGAKTMAVRVASNGAGGNIELHLDSAAGTTLGTCVVPVTGGGQTWTTQTCALSAANGTHDVYLVFTGSGGSLFSLEWFALRPA